MKKVILCKLCLIVFGALLAVQSAFAKDRDGVWYCYSETDVAALPEGVYEANPYTWKAGVIAFIRYPLWLTVWLSSESHSSVDTRLPRCTDFCGFY
jgi:hypothetical protein